MKERFFWIALGLIGISWIVNSIYAYSKHLDEPIFLDHYIDVEYQENLYMTFYYLTNKNDTSVVSSVAAGEMVGYPECNYFFDGQIQNSQSFNNHVLRKITVQFNTYHLEQAFQSENTSFTELDVFFTNGKKITVPIGIVKIRPFVPYGDEIIPLEQVSAMSGGSNFNHAFYRATEPLTVNTIKGSFQDALQDNFFIKVNILNDPSAPEITNKDFIDQMQMDWKRVPGLELRNVQFPLDLKEQETLSVYSSIPANFKAVLELSIYISGTTGLGEIFSTTAGFIHQPYLEQKDVNEIIKKKMKGDSDG